MPSITDLLEDSDFKAASPEEQQSLVLRFNAKYGPSGKKPDLQPVPQSRFEKGLNAPEFDALKGGAFGYLTGGGALGTAIGMAHPPESMADYAEGIMGGALGKLGGKIMQKLPKGLASVLGAGVLGGANTEALNATRELTNRAMGQKEKDNKPLLTTDPTALALGAGVPMATQRLFTEAVRNSPVKKSNDLMNEQLGTQTPISQGGQIQTQPVNPALEQVRQTGAQLTTPQLAQNQGQQKGIISRLAQIAETKKLQAEARANLAVTAQGREIQKKKIIAEKIRTETGISKNPVEITPADEMRATKFDQFDTDILNKQEEIRQLKKGEPTEIYDPETGKSTTVNKVQHDIVEGAQQELHQLRLDRLNHQAETIRTAAEERLTPGVEDPSKLQTANVNTEIGRIKKTQAQSTAQTKRLDTENTRLTTALTGLKTQASELQNAMNPSLRKLAWESPDATTLVRNMFDPKMTPEGVSAFVDHLKAKGGPGTVEALQSSMLEEFFKRAYNPQTKSLDNASKMFAPDGAFSPEKVEALFGRDKVMKLQQAFDDINRATADLSKGQGFANYSAHHFLGWVLPTALLFHSNLDTSVEKIAAGAAIGGAGFLAAKWPAIINGILKNPKLGDMFHKWAMSDRQSRSLRNWPTIANFLKENSEPVSSPDAVSASAPQ